MTCSPLSSIPIHPAAAARVAKSPTFPTRARAPLCTPIPSRPLASTRAARIPVPRPLLSIRRHAYPIPSHLRSPPDSPALTATRARQDATQPRVDCLITCPFRGLTCQVNSCLFPVDFDCDRGASSPRHGPARCPRMLAPRARPVARTTYSCSPRLSRPRLRTRLRVHPSLASGCASRNLPCPQRLLVRLSSAELSCPVRRSPSPRPTGLAPRRLASTLFHS